VIIVRIYCSLILYFLLKFFWNSPPYHIWSLFHARTEVFLLYHKLLAEGSDVSRSEHALNFSLAVDIVVLQFDIASGIVGWHHVGELQMSYPCVVLKCILQYFLKLSNVLYYFRF